MKIVLVEEESVDDNFWLSADIIKCLCIDVEYLSTRCIIRFVGKVEIGKELFPSYLSVVTWNIFLVF